MCCQLQDWKPRILREYSGKHVLNSRCEISEEDRSEGEIELWKLNPKGEREFLAGKDNWKAAAEAAENCTAFKEDVEEEQAANQLRSCYNCGNRRWTRLSFVCCRS